MTILIVFGWTLFGIAILVGLALDLLGLFGNWIILAAMACAWAFSGFDYFGWQGLAIMLVFAIAGEVLETVAAGYGAKKFGGGKGSIVAALVGCILGAILFTPLIPIPLVGTLIGACLGAFLGAALYEYIQMEKKVGQALWTGLGAALGKVAGVFAKLAMGFGMLITAALTF
ncbi:MAG: DUF456 domain-containing protein [Candidatus Hydrogenedentales bacterium]|jgi:hypothetical protein